MTELLGTLDDCPVYEFRHGGQWVIARRIRHLREGKGFWLMYSERTRKLITVQADEEMRLVVEGTHSDE